MLMNDKIIFDRYYRINSSQTKEIMVHYILQPHHIFIRIKVFILMCVPGVLQLLIISMCYAWCPETSINTVPVKNQQHIPLFSEDPKLFFSEKER